MLKFIVLLTILVTLAGAFDLGPRSISRQCGGTGNCARNDKCPSGCGPDNKDVFLPFPGDCTRYYHCSGGAACEMNCPGGLHWNVAKDICDYPENANCNNTGSSGCCEQNCVVCCK